MKLRRYEILLPLTYNDGRKIEAVKFLKTNKELRQEFGGFAFDTTVVYGIWVYQGTARDFSSVDPKMKIPTSYPKCLWESHLR